MPDLSIQWSGLTEVVAKFEALPQKRRDSLRLVIGELIDELKSAVEENLSGEVLNIRSGRLIGSLENGITEETDSKVSGKVWTNEDYARIQEYGGVTQPHIIVVQHALAMRFEVRGEQHFAHHVRHPGSKMPERSYARSALRTMLPRIKSAFGMV